MKKEKQNDLGNDRIGSLLTRLAVPAILAQIINALYNIVDRIYISRIPLVGEDALTGVGVTFPILMIVSAFSAFVGMGGAPRAAIKMGEGKNDEAEKILGNCFVLLLAISAILTAVFTIWGRGMLLSFGASENTIDYADSYMKIYVMGTVFVQIALGLNSFISTQGFAKISMQTVLFGALTNIVLDPIFIFGLKMGVKGAALATVISQTVSAVWVLFFLFSKKSQIRIKPKNFGLKPSVFLPVFALGTAPFIMQSTESLVNIVLNSSLQKYGGDSAVGAMTIIGSVMQFCTMPLAGLGQSGQPIISYNFGAGKMDRVKKTFKLLFASAMIYSGCMWLLAMLFPQMFVSLFASGKPELAEISIWAMRIFMAGTFAMGAQFACQQSFVALGQAGISVFMALLRKILLLIPLVYILPLFFQNKVFSVFLAEPIADITAATITTTVFLLSFNKILGKKTKELEGN